MPQGDIIVKKRNTVILTGRRVELAQLIADDWTRKEIAKKYKVSVRAIESHCNAMRKSLGCNGIPAMIAVLFRKGLIK